MNGQTATALAEPLTGHGTILGTLQYMAPEQLEGKEADARTDIFALGALTYEMITGRQGIRRRNTGLCDCENPRDEPRNSVGVILNWQALLQAPRSR